MKFNGRKVARVLLAMIVLLVVPVVGVVAWQWQDGVAVKRIEVLGTRNADRQAILALARVDTGMALYSVSPVLVADRVRRHPWVDAAEVERVPSGTLRLRIQERVPVALALSRAGRPAFFLDSAATVMPHVSGAAYDVPLIRGIDGLNKKGTGPAANAAIAELVRTLGRLEPEVGALISDIEVRRGEVWLHTTPIDRRGSIPVRLGTSGFDEKLARLHAFWRQAVLTQPEQVFDVIDLRFNGQVVTNEAAGEEPAASDSLRRQD